MTPSRLPRTTRQNECVANNSDTLRYECTVNAKIDAFKHRFFIRTYKMWNNLPLSIREVVDSDNFVSSLKNQLWLLLGLKPD